MGRKASNATSVVIQRLVDIGAAALVEQLDLPPAQARTAMREVAHLFASEYGGSEVYIAKDRDFALEQRDLLIFERMDRGGSSLDVARDYGLTPRQVQIITRHVREQDPGRLRQGDLPGFDADA